MLKTYWRTKRQKQSKHSILSAMANNKLECHLLNQARCPSSLRYMKYMNAKIELTEMEGDGSSYYALVHPLSNHVKSIIPAIRLDGVQAKMPQ